MQNLWASLHITVHVSGTKVDITDCIHATDSLNTKFRNYRFNEKQMPACPTNTEHCNVQSLQFSAEKF